MGKGNKWIEKLRILGWERPSAWRGGVCRFHICRDETAPDVGALFVLDGQKSAPCRTSNHDKFRERGKPDCQSLCFPRCPKARHLGHPVLRLVKNYRHPGHLPPLTCSVPCPCP